MALCPGLWRFIAQDSANLLWHNSEGEWLERATVIVEVSNVVLVNSGNVCWFPFK